MIYNGFTELYFEEKCFATYKFVCEKSTGKRIFLFTGFFYKKNLKKFGGPMLQRLFKVII